MDEQRVREIIEEHDNQLAAALEAAIARRRNYIAPPMTYVSPGTTVTPVSRWQRLLWWLRRVMP